MAEICIIGPRKSGKTTYLATLLRMPEKLSQKYPGLQITPIGKNARKLREQAVEILETNALLTGTRPEEGEEPFYTFQIDLPKPRFGSKSSLEVTVRDYAGEVITIAKKDHRSALEEKELKPYVSQWCTTTSWMFLITDWQPERDQELYEPAFQEIFQHITQACSRNPTFKDSLQVAVVLTKSERGELWPCRLDPEEDVFKVRLPKTYEIFKKIRTQLSGRLKFFACSSFGVLDEQCDPRPNRCFDSDNPEAKAYLKDKQAWCPYGLLSPMYWLSTGMMLHDESL